MRLPMFNRAVNASNSDCPLLQFVLFGLRPNLALYPGRSISSHSNGYDFSADSPAYFASLTLIPEPFVKYAGKP